MHKIPVVRAIILIGIGALLVACATPAPSPTPTVTAPSPTAPATPKASPIPTQAPALTPQYGGVFKPGSGNPPRSIAIGINTIKNWYTLVAYDTLLRLDEKGDLQPNLATDWKLSSDNKSLTLTLRKGVKFHDGTDFNAEAAKWNIENRKARKLGDYDQVESVSVIDDHTVRLNLSRFENALFTTLWFIGGMMTSPAAYAKFGEDAHNWNPVGTGPFKFVSYVRDTVVKYERFDGYWQKGKPYLDGFEQYIIPDETTRELALRKGEIEAVEGALPGKTTAEIEALGFGLILAEVETYQAFVPDSVNADSPFAKNKVREAVEYAIDKESIVKALGYGRTETLYQMTPSTTYAYIPDLKGRRYDPAKAKQLLTEAGYPNGFKTSLFVRATAGTTASEEVVAVQGHLKAVGIDATIQPLDRIGATRLVQTGWKNGLAHRSIRTVPDWLSYTYLMTSSTSVENYSMLRPPGYQDLLERAMVATDMASKKAASQQIVRKIYDEAMAIPLMGSLSGVTYSPKVHNLKYYLPWGANKFWGPAEVWKSK